METSCRARVHARTVYRVSTVATPSIPAFALRSVLVKHAVQPTDAVVCVKHARPAEAVFRHLPGRGRVALRHVRESNAVQPTDAVAYVQRLIPSVLPEQAA